MRPASLKSKLSDRSFVFEDRSSRTVYSFDQGEVPSGLKKLLIPDTEPDLVAQPGTIEDLVACVRHSLDSGCPVIPRGASTFGMGGAIAHHGGLMLDLSPRREIYDFDSENELIRVGAGCRWADVSQFLAPLGYDLRTYPTSWFSTVGGWAATGGIGIGCTRYGSFHEFIHSITVVTAAGEIAHLTKNDPDFHCFLGTEGQMGAIWDITFAVRKKPSVQFPFLLLFDSGEEALAAAGELLSIFRPYHLKYLDAFRIHEINRLQREEHPHLPSDKQLPEKHTLLFCLEKEGEKPVALEELHGMARKNGWTIVSDYRAHLLWRERMFPLRVKRIAPGLLASELILPIERVAPFAQKASALGASFSVDLATECYFMNDGTALTLPVFTFHSHHPVDEAVKSSLAYVLTQTGISMGGRPYGTGIWNTPFVKSRFGNRFPELKSYKKRVDPQHLFNPGKFFQMKFRSGLAGKLAAFPLRSGLIPIWSAILPKMSSFLTRGNGADSRPSDLIALNEELCSKCGSCIPVCPAYIETRDERTTARGKLHLAKVLQNGNQLTGEEANTLFLCMHCGACTDVCQSRLDLVPVWDELERRVEVQFGKDQARVETFVQSVEESKIMGVPYARGFNVLAGNQSE